MKKLIFTVLIIALGMEAKAQELLITVEGWNRFIDEEFPAPHGSSCFGGICGSFSPQHPSFLVNLAEESLQKYKKLNTMEQIGIATPWTAASILGSLPRYEEQMVCNGGSFCLTVLPRISTPDSRSLSGLNIRYTHFSYSITSIEATTTIIVEGVQRYTGKVHFSSSLYGQFGAIPEPSTFVILMGVLLYHRRSH